jgi:GAF domain-containing protein
LESTSQPSQNLSVTGDAARLAALRETDLLDSVPEEVFDRMTRLAAKRVRAPATFISLVDEKRDSYKSCVGFGEPLATVRQLEGTTFCHYAISGERPLVIPDTRADPLYRNVPTVESLGVAAYQGVPIRTAEGHALGSFCAIDFQPREWTGTEVEVMVELAASAEREITLRRDVTRQRQAAERAGTHHADVPRVCSAHSRCRAARSTSLAADARLSPALWSNNVLQRTCGRRRSRVL